ncbi:histidinol-phosphatase [Planctomycetota bacterium]|nr:histidinol-phosphatase [Planctomycetota bacterium]
MPQPILYETHTHTTLCKHADGSISDYADHAIARNLAGLTVTCHNPLPDNLSIAVRMREDQLPEYLKLVADAKAKYANKLDVLTGMEFDFAPEFIPYLQNQIESTKFDYCLGSIHPQTDYYMDRYHSDDPFENQKIYFDMIAKVAESKLFDCVSHPDLIKIFTKKHWNYEAIEPVIIDMLDRVAVTNVAMELNTSGEIKSFPEFNPSTRILEKMFKRSIPVVIGSDSHTPKRVADRWEKALNTLASVGYTEINYFKNRERIAVPIQNALASLTPA